MSDEQLDKLDIEVTPDMKAEVAQRVRRLKATEPEEIRQAVAWLIENQEDDVEFPEKGKSVLADRPFTPRAEGTGNAETRGSKSKGRR